MANMKLLEYIRQNCNEFSSLADDPSLKDLFDEAYREGKMGSDSMATLLGILGLYQYVFII
ncbi:hypothetical protein HAX54_010622, partial [Datura stramonium]|nr:hypothetical protein [Datura stramonium]